MKLGPDMYYLNIFHFLKNKGENEWAARIHIQRNTKKCHEINSIPTLKSPNNTLQMAMNVGIFLM